MVIPINNFIIHHYLTDIILSWNNNNDQMRIKRLKNLRILFLKGKELKYHYFFKYY